MKKGGLITLSDAQTISAYSDDRLVPSVTFEVEAIEEFALGELSLKVYDLENNLYLFVSSCKDVTTYQVGFTIPEIPPSIRSKMENRELFYKDDDYDFVDSVDAGCDVFSNLQVFSGAKMEEEPLFTSLAEWTCEGIDNPNLILVEVGQLDPFVRVFQACTISPTEVQFLN